MHAVKKISLLLLPIFVLAGKGPVPAAVAAGKEVKEAPPPMCRFNCDDQLDDRYWPDQAVTGCCTVNPAWFNKQKVCEWKSQPLGIDL